MMGVFAKYSPGISAHLPLTDILGMLRVALLHLKFMSSSGFTLGHGAKTARSCSRWCPVGGGWKKNKKTPNFH